MKARPGRASSGARELPREVRIIGGQWKRTKLPVADRPGLRPTPDRVRETLFNWLGQTLDGWRCLDAFAGSGALGFEAASRGAAEVVLIERDPVLVASLAATRQRLHAETVRVERADALQWMARAPAAAFDVVFLDPPFGDDPWQALFAALDPLIGERSFIYAEASRRIAPPAALDVVRQARAGGVHYHLLARNAQAANR